MKVYIIGKYTGLNREFAVEKFNISEEQLIAAGVPAEDIINPVKLVPEGTDWHTAMHKYCIPAVKRCTAVFVQIDWQDDSRGAKIEMNLALLLRKDRFFEAYNGLHQIRQLLELMT
jgi:hypothetical protein